VPAKPGEVDNGVGLATACAPVSEPLLSITLWIQYILNLAWPTSLSFQPIQRVNRAQPIGENRHKRKSLGSCRLKSCSCELQRYSADKLCHKLCQMSLVRGQWAAPAFTLHSTLTIQDKPRTARPAHVLPLRVRECAVL
jgi:hypothetical protein